MRQRAFAVFITAALAVAFAGAPGARGVAQPVTDAAPTPAPCSTSDLETVMDVYETAPTPHAHLPHIPSGAESYLEQVLTQRLATCALALRNSPGRPCSPDARDRGNARALWRQLRFCSAIVESSHRVPELPGVLVRAQEPTIYVLLGSGAPSGAGGGSASNAGGTKAQGGAATGSTATGSSVDNPDAFMLFVLARRLEYGVCERRLGLGVGSDRKALQAADDQCHVNHVVAVIPESEWTVEDFRAQCIEDPYSTEPQTGNPNGVPHGTLGAVILNGAIRTEDGTFNLLTITGGSEASFGAQVVDCTGGRPPLSTVWSDNLSDGNKTTAFSLFPVALAGTILEARWAARAATLPAPGPSASPNLLGAYVDYETGVAFGTFAAGVSGLTIGNPSSALTLEHAFDAWSTDFERNLIGFCARTYQEGAQAPICGANALDMQPTPSR